jgi:hypothetical protein
MLNSFLNVNVYVNINIEKEKKPRNTTSRVSLILQSSNFVYTIQSSTSHIRRFSSGIRCVIQLSNAKRKQ